MGVKKRLKGFFKSQQRKEQEDLKNRAKQFLEEYKTIRARYQCDFQAYIELVDQGEGGTRPKIRVIDSTKQVEAEEVAERKKEELKEKQRLEKEGKTEKNENTKSQN